MAKHNSSQIDNIYKNYIADTFYYQNQGKMISLRYDDVLNYKPETRDAEEIITDVLEKAGLRIE